MFFLNVNVLWFLLFVSKQGRKINKNCVAVKERRTGQKRRIIKNNERTCHSSCIINSFNHFAHGLGVSYYHLLCLEKFHFSSFPHTFSYGELAGSAENSCWKRCQSCNQGCGEQWSLCCHQNGQAGTIFSPFVIINFLTFFHLLLLGHVPEGIDLFSVIFSLISFLYS